MNDIFDSLTETKFAVPSLALNKRVRDLFHKLVVTVRQDPLKEFITDRI